MENKNMGSLIFNSKTGEFKYDDKLSQVDPEKNKADNVEKNIDDKTDIMSKKPKLAFNTKTGVFEYADENIRKIQEVRAKLRQDHDPLEVKQKYIEQGLDEVGLSGSMGKTGDSKTGEITEKHKKTADSQIEDAKEEMIKNRLKKEVNR